MVRTLAVFLIGYLAGAPAMAIDLAALWDFSNPELSEQRFRSALETAAGDDALILQTQIARTYMLRNDFREARNLLQSIGPQGESAGPEVKVRYWLELGRTYASHRHFAESQTPESRQLARAAFTNALDIAREAKLDGLAIDAIHMFALVDTAPQDQLKRGLEALALVEASDQREAKQWEASIRSNTGEALYDLGRYDEALVHFRKCLAIREQRADPRATRDANWHIARVLRVQNRVDEALAIQLRLERESEAAHDPRDYIFEELEVLYRSKGCDACARYYAKRAKSLAK
jgi:tetratricopeptide (TPR) repeat protein